MTLTDDVNFVLLQYWEVSEYGDECFSDGVSLHMNMSDRNSYLSIKYNNRSTKCVSNTYDRIVGESIVVTVSDIIFDRVSKNGTFKLREHEFNNLVNIGDINLI